MPADKLTHAGFDALRSVCLSTAYLPPIEYIALWLHADTCYLEQYEFYEKQSYRNRCRIATASGMMELSIPVERPSGNRTLIREIRLSDHGNWRHQHWKAIEAAYQSSPFFEFLIDDLERVYQHPSAYLWDFNLQLMEVIKAWIEIPKSVLFTTAFGNLPENTVSLRERLHPKKGLLSEQCKPYYQVFSETTGFLAGLSILDLIMNMGNESILYRVSVV